MIACFMHWWGRYIYWVPVFRRDCNCIYLDGFTYEVLV